MSDFAQAVDAVVDPFLAEFFSDMEHIDNADRMARTDAEAYLRRIGSRRLLGLADEIAAGAYTFWDDTAE